MPEQNLGRRRPTATERRQAKLTTWQNRITRARSLRQQWEEKYHVDELAMLYLGEPESTLSINERTESKVNRFWPTIKAMLPGFLSQAPTFVLRTPPKSRTVLTAENAMVGESVLNALARQDNALEQAARLAILQAFWRIGVLKVVYDPTTERNPRRGEPRFLTDNQGHPILDELSGLPQPLLDPDTGEAMTEPNEIVSDEVYVWRWVNGCNLLLPQAGPDSSQWPWIGEEITVPLDDAKEDERFPAKLRDQLTANKVDRTGRDQPQDFPLTEGLRDTEDPEITYIEIWDHKVKERLILIEGQAFSNTEFLLEEDTPEGVEDNPYSLLIFNPIIDPEPSAWPLPMTWNWRMLQKDLHVRREQISAAAGRSARKIYYDENTFADFDQAQLSLQSTRDMEAVKLRDINRPPVVLPDPSAPPDITRDYVLLTDEWRTVTGQTGARIADPDSDTATEAVLSEQAAVLRDTLERNVVQDWMAMAGKKMLQRLKATLTLGLLVKLRSWNDREVQEYVARVYGPQVSQALQVIPALRQSFLQRFGQEQWSRIDREQLQFEADVVLAPGSMRLRTVDSERQQLLSLVRLIAEAPIITLFPELLRTLGEMFEFVDDRIIEEMAIRGPQILQAQAQAGASGGRQATNNAASAAGPPQAETAQVLGSRLAGALLSGGLR